MTIDALPTGIAPIGHLMDQKVSRTGQLQDRSTAGQFSSCRTGQLQDRPTVGQVNCRTGQLQDRLIAIVGQDWSVTGQINSSIAGQVNNRTDQQQDRSMNRLTAGQEGDQILPAHR